MEKTLTIKSHRGDYRVFFESDLGFLETLKKRGGIWVIDRNVFNLYQPHFSGINPDSLLLFDASEENKTPDAALRLCRDLVAKSCRRETDFISVGGGIVQDITGFAASMLYRGLKWTYVPTTLLAQADSCIGSKTSLNLDSYKNLLGTFYPPKEIFISTEFLNTLPLREVFSGRGEIIKLLMMKAMTLENLASLAARLEKDSLPNLLFDTLVVKKGYIEEDEFDEGRRKFLNYGHCFGHALESVSAFAIPHGLAVIAGMMFASIVSRKRNWIDGEVSDLLVNKILVPAFHAELLNMQESFFDKEALWRAMRKDKKRIGDGVAIILPQRSLELVLTQDLSRDELEYGANDLKSAIKPG